MIEYRSMLERVLAKSGQTGRDMRIRLYQVAAQQLDKRFGGTPELHTKHRSLLYDAIRTIEAEYQMELDSHAGKSQPPGEVNTNGDAVPIPVLPVLRGKLTVSNPGRMNGSHHHVEPLQTRQDFNGRGLPGMSGDYYPAKEGDPFRHQSITHYLAPDTFARSPDYPDWEIAAGRSRAWISVPVVVVLAATSAYAWYARQPGADTRELERLPVQVGQVVTESRDNKGSSVSSNVQTNPSLPLDETLAIYDGPFKTTVRQFSTEWAGTEDQALMAKVDSEGLVLPNGKGIYGRHFARIDSSRTYRATMKVRLVGENGFENTAIYAGFLTYDKDRNLLEDSGPVIRDFIHSGPLGKAPQTGDGWVLLEGTIAMEGSLVRSTLRPGTVFVRPAIFLRPGDDSARLTIQDLHFEEY